MKMTNLSVTSVTLTAAMLLIAGMPRHGRGPDNAAESKFADHW
jgi:hypothetical protein